MRVSLKVCSVVFAVALIVSVMFNVYFAWTMHNINRRMIDERTILLERVQLTLGMARAAANGAFHALADEQWERALLHLGKLDGHLSDLLFLLYPVAYFPEEEYRIFAYGLRDKIDNASKIVMKIMVNLENGIVNESDVNFLAKLSEALRMAEQSINLRFSSGASEYCIDNIDEILAKFDEATEAHARAVNETAPMNFSILVTPSKGEAKIGGNVTATVTVILESGTPQTVNLLILLPPGMVMGVTFQPRQGIPTFTSKMTLQVPETIPEGNYDIIVMATSGDLAKTATFKLTVRNTQAEKNSGSK